MAYIPPKHKLTKESFITNSEIDIDDLLLLNEGHCFRNSVLNLCQSSPSLSAKSVDLASGNFDTLVKLSKKGYGMTLLPYLYAIDLAEEEQIFVKPIADPKPTREISLVYTRAELKIKVIEELAQIIKNSVPEKLLAESDQVLSPVTQV
jgi:LysR family hydrogen peroxide-inducible transcriptional activator